MKTKNVTPLFDFTRFGYLAKIFMMIALFGASTMFYSCTESEVEEEVEQEEVEPEVEPEDNPSITGDFYLADISADVLPSFDEWVILDETASASDFAGFSAALMSLSDTDREISVEFTNLEAIPAYAIFGGTSFNEDDLDDETFAALVEVSAPAAVTVGEASLAWCTSLTTVSLGSAEELSGVVFASCSSLVDLTLATSDTVLSSVDAEAFDECSTENIALVVGDGNANYIHGNTITVGEFTATFKSISNEEGEEYVIPSTTVALADISADAIPETDLWIITDASADSYSNFAGLKAAIAALDDSDRKISLEFPNLESFPSSALASSSSTYNLTALVSVKAEVATTINTSAFAYCDGIQSISAPAAVTVGNTAFRAALALVDINMPEVTSYGSFVFRGCESLTNFVLPVTLSSVSFNIFLECTALKNVDCSGNSSFSFVDGFVCTDNGSNVYSALPAIMSGSVTIPSSVTSLSTCAFDGCNNMTSVSGASVTTGGDSTFYDCTALKEVDLPLLSSVGTFSFAYCNQLVDIKLPSLISIGMYSFRVDTDIDYNMQSISLATNSGAKISSWGYYLFTDIDITTVDLTLGESNAEYVDGATFKFGSISQTFKSITLVDGDGNVVSTTKNEDDGQEDDAFTAELSVSNITQTSADVAWTVSDATQNYLYGLFTAEGLSAYSDSDLMSGFISYYSSNGVLSTYTFAGDAYGTFSPLTAGTEYMLFVFAVDESYNPTSDLFKLNFTTLESTAGQGSDEYKKWLGTWNLTSTSLTVTGEPLTLQITITEGMEADTYSIYGFDLTTGRNDYAMPATFDSETNGWTVAASSEVGSYSTYTAMYCSYSYIGGAYNTYSIVTGSYNALTATLGSDEESGSIACYQGEISTGDPFTVQTVRLYLYDGTYYYNFYNDTDNLNVDSGDALVGPFTLSKVSSSSSAPAKAPAAASQFNGLNLFDMAVQKALTYKSDSGINTTVHSLK